MKFLANDFLDNFERDAARKNERYTLVFGTHLNNTSARDISQFPQDQGATTKARLLRSKEETTRVLRKLAISHAGCGDFLVPPRCGCVAVALATASLPRLADTRKSLATRAGSIIEMGSGEFFLASRSRNYLKSAATGIS